MGMLERLRRRESYLAGAAIRKKGTLSTEAAADGDAAASPYMESKSNQRRHRAKLLDCRQCYTAMPYCDGYEWRKYGEKKISSSDFNRCYYKCTNDPCPAKKRVEQYNNADPPLYLVSYQEEHICNLAPSTAHHQVPMPYSTPNSPFLFSSVRSPNFQKGQEEQLQFNPSFSTVVNPENESDPEIKIPISNSPGMQTTLPCIMTPVSMEVETDISEYVTSWWNLPPTSPPLTPGCMNPMENYASEIYFDELKYFPPTLSVTEHGSHGETSGRKQGSIDNSLLNLPAVPDLMSSSFTTQDGHGEAGAIDQSNAVITSSDEPASSGIMMPNGFTEMGDHDSIFFSSPDFEVDYSEILALLDSP